MALDEVAARGLVLLGCGKMGGALLKGWLAGGLPAGAVHVIEPNPSDWLRATGAALNGPLPEAPAVALVAVKPQMMGAALPSLVALGGGRRWSCPSPRARRSAPSRRPSGPARRSSAPCPTRPPRSAGASPPHRQRRRRPRRSCARRSPPLGRGRGRPARLRGADGRRHRRLGLGPAYVFHLIEALAAAGEAEGLPPTSPCASPARPWPGPGRSRRRPGRTPRSSAAT
jgi:pyrroline-5-carboxylate reductase